MYDITTVYQIVDLVLARLGMEQGDAPTLILWDEVPGNLPEAVRRVQRHAPGSAYSVWEPEGLAAPPYPMGELALLEKERYQSYLYRSRHLYLPVCGLSMMAKIALGIGDTPISRMVQTAVMAGKAVTLSPGEKARFPPAYRTLWEEYARKIRTLGVVIQEDAPLPETGRCGAPEGVQPRRKTLIDAAYVRQMEGTELLITPDVVVTPLAKDAARQKNITLRYGKE